jgi:nicotinamide-nucleotide amidase
MLLAGNRWSRWEWVQHHWGTNPFMTELHSADVGVADAAGRIANDMRRSDTTAAAAESVSGGHIATRLAAAEGASQWFRGSITAYSEVAKFTVLNVRPGPVITADCARQMAIGAAQLLKADFAVSTTGAGGPGPEEDQPPGTVFIAVASPADCVAKEYHFDGDPETIVRKATAQALHDMAIVTGRECRSRSAATD